MTEDFQPAAVLIPIYVEEGEEFVLFTKRSELVQHHKGQICFPGGAVEKKDENLWQTALRETEEEIGIHSHEVFYICELPKIKTPTLFEITPFVGLVHTDFKITPNLDEIDEVFAAPLDHFRDPKHIRFEEHSVLDQTIEIPFFSYSGYEIWGATGRILNCLLEMW